MNAQAIISWIIIGCIAAIGLMSKIWVINQFGGVSGGDAYNYLFITQSLISGDNPFENTKRLPGYPLTLAPFMLSEKIDIEYTMRAIQIAASIWAVAMVTLITRSLKLPWVVAICASAILTFQKDFFWTSMRPEPYTLYTALLLTAVWLFIEIQNKPTYWRYIVFGITIGYAAMTRQEGFVLAAVLGICSALYEIYSAYHTKSIRTSTIRFTAMYLPALLIVLPFFIHNVSKYGNPLYTPYLEGDRLQIVDSFLAFQDATGATWGIISSMWKPAWDQLERVEFTSDLFLISAAGLFAWYWYSQKSNKNAKSSLPHLFIGVSFIGLSLYYFLIEEKIFNATVPIITSAWIIVSIPLFLFKTKWKGALLLLITLSQVGIATWFHPFAKHYQQVYPIIVLMLATVILAYMPKSRVARLTVLIAGMIPFILISSLLHNHINASIDEANEDAALDSVVYRATRYAKELNKHTGFDQAYLPARFYFDPGINFFDDEEAPAHKRIDWLRQQKIKILVVTNTTKTFETPDPNWKILKTFKASGKHEFIFVSTVYAI